MKQPLPILILCISILLLSACQSPPVHPNDSSTKTQELSKFSSADELSTFLQTHEHVPIYQQYSKGIAFEQAAASADKGISQLGTAPLSIPNSASSDHRTSYSTTNIQVQGVDEPDIVKNDGKYVYVLSQQTGKISILDAYPAQQAKVISTITPENEMYFQQLFLENHKLIVVGNSYNYDIYPVPMIEANAVQEKEEKVAPQIVSRPLPRSSGPQTFVRVYDVNTPATPTLVETMTIDGNYVNARLTNGIVYLITNYWLNYANNNQLPILRTESKEMPVLANEIYYDDTYDNGYTLTTISSLRLSDSNANHASFLLGSLAQLYASQENIYLTQQKTLSPQQETEILLDELQDILSDQTRDEIQKIKNQQLLPSIEQQEISEILQPILYGYEQYSTTSEQLINTFNNALPATILAQLNKISKSTLEEQKKQRYIMQLISQYTNSQQAQEEPQKTKLQNAFKTLKQRAEQFRKRTELVQERLRQERDKTIIHKLHINDGKITLAATGIVNGVPLNSYSMDEYNNYFRIATTSGPWAQTNNNIYVFNSKLTLIGKLEGLGKTERIYSARFMNNKAFLVTFKQTDPFFVIDLSDPTTPRLLGELKLPGFSTYLHPYDDNHIIGIGRQTNEQGRQQGIKVTLFDVTDPTNPVRVAAESFESNTDSEALNEPKAVLFDKEKNLLVIPLYKYPMYNYVQPVPIMTEEKTTAKQTSTIQRPQPNAPEYLAAVFTITPTSLTLKGTISHETSVRRSLYIDNTLYTISDSMHANDLITLQQINEVKIDKTIKNEPLQYIDDGGILAR